MRVGVLFGGRSGEHEVSLASAASVIRGLDPAKYEPIPIGITKEGHWRVGAGAQKMLPDVLHGGQPVMMTAIRPTLRWCRLAAMEVTAAQQHRSLTWFSL